MAEKIKRQRFSKNEWLEAGLSMLASQGVDKLTISSLSRQVGVAKTSFYWHFKDRQDLLDHMLIYWVKDFNLIFTQDEELFELPSIARMKKMIQMIIENQTVKYELAIVSWARTDLRVKTVFDEAQNSRIEFLHKAFQDAGFSDDEVESRSKYLLCYISWGGFIQGDPHSHIDDLEHLVDILFTPPQ